MVGGLCIASPSSLHSRGQHLSIFQIVCTKFFGGPLGLLRSFSAGIVQSGMAMVVA